jgi:Na+/melibiose symporter-like transporter
MMRLSALVVGLSTRFLFFQFGFTEWQHIILYIIIGNLKSVFTTASNVAGAKVWAQISPYSKQREKLAVVQAFASTLHDSVTGIYWFIIGFREIIWETFHVNEYQIILVGVILFSIPALFTDMMPSFVYQRVPDKPTQKQAAKGTFRGFCRDIADGFSVMRYNKYFILQTLFSFITTFTPSVNDPDFYRYNNVDKVVRLGKLKGEALMTIRGAVVYLPGVLLQPFSVKLIRLLGGERKTMIWTQVAIAFFGIARAIVGVKSIWGFLFLWFGEMVTFSFSKVEATAAKTIEYDMYDYVEYKTGRRTEGVGAGVKGLLDKMVVSNFNTIIGNLFMYKMGFDPKLGDANQPAKYMKYSTLFYLLMPGIDGCLWLIARILYKYPDSLKAKVEAELIERRRLEAQQNAAQGEP